MKRYIIAAVTVIAVLAITLGLYAQPAGGGMGGFGGGGMDFGAMGGARGMRRMTERPEKKERLAAVEELTKQVAALKAAIEKAPDTNPDFANLEGEELTKAMEPFTVERQAINEIQTTLSTISGGTGRMRGGAQEDVLSELRVLANGEKATKTVARLDALIKEAQDRTARRGQGGRTGAGGRGNRGAN